MSMKYPKKIVINSDGQPFTDKFYYLTFESLKDVTISIVAHCKGAGHNHEGSQDGKEKKDANKTNQKDPKKVIGYEIKQSIEKAMYDKATEHKLLDEYRRARRNTRM